MKQGAITCALCGGDLEMMIGDYIFGVGFDCPSCVDRKQKRRQELLKEDGE